MKNQYVIKTKVLFGEQALAELKKLSCRHAFLVSDAMMEQLGYLEEIKSLLASAAMNITVFSEVRPDPDAAIVANGMKLFCQSNADLLIALGGGSVIDTAKGILYAAKEWRQNVQPADRPLFIAIPTTSGTGSEVTDFSVITVKDEKVCIVDDYIAPDIAILDVGLKKDIPSRIAVDTGIDVLVHAVEAYLSVNAGDFTDALAEKAVRLVFAHLEMLAKDPACPLAGERLQNASCLAGMAFNNAGLGIVHSLSHAFGARFHLSHGRANALLLCPVLEYQTNLAGTINEPVCQRLAQLAALMNLPARTAREGAVSFMRQIKLLKKQLGIEDHIKAAGVPAEAFEAAVEQMAETALRDRCTATSPVVPTREAILAIYQKAYCAEQSYRY